MTDVVMDRRSLCRSQTCLLIRHFSYLFFPPADLVHIMSHSGSTSRDRSKQCGCVCVCVQVDHRKTFKKGHELIEIELLFLFEIGAHRVS